MKAWGLKHMRDTKDLREFISTERKVNMPAADKAAVMEQAKRDSEFLATIGVNDYSLLLGILRKRSTGLAAATPSSSNPSTTAVFAKSEVGLERAAPSMKASNDNVAATADDGADNAASVAITEKDPTTVAGSAIGIHMESLTVTPAQSATRNPSNASEIGIATRNPPTMSIVTAETNRRSSNNSVTDVEMRHPYVHKSEDGNELYFLSLIDILSDFEWNRELGHYLLPRLWQWFPRYIQPAEYARRIQQTLARVLQ